MKTNQSHFVKYNPCYSSLSLKEKEGKKEIKKSVQKLEDYA